LLSEIVNQTSLSDVKQETIDRLTAATSQRGAVAAGPRLTTRGWSRSKPFRSLVIAAKAIVLNLLSVTAAYGAMVLVFQHLEHGATPHGPAEPATVPPATAAETG